MLFQSTHEDRQGAEAPAEPGERIAKSPLQYTLTALPTNEENYREEILDRVEEGWIEEDWTRTMPRLLNDHL